MKRTKRFAEGGFSKEQESWLGGADRTDPYILARMRKAVPDSVAKEPETAMDDGTTEGISAAAAAKTEAPASTAFMDEKEPGWDTKSAPAKSAPAKSTPAKSTTVNDDNRPTKANAAKRFTATDTGDETDRLAAKYKNNPEGPSTRGSGMDSIMALVARNASPTKGGRGSGYKPALKQGGAVKKMASGGSASRRADGIAQRGKTRGKMC